MPHKVTTVGLLDEASTAVKVAGSCNAVLVRSDGKVVGDMFDGAGFARGLKRKGFDVAGRLVPDLRDRRRRLRDRGFARGRRRRAHGAVRHERGVRGRSRGAPARSTIPTMRGDDRLQRSRGLRPHRQRDAARHEGGRSAAVRRVAHREGHVRRRGGDEAGDHAAPAKRRARSAAARRSAPTCCSSRFPRISSSSGSAPTTPDELRSVAKVSY